MGDGGKGSSPRPFTDRKTFEENFDRIFKQDKEKLNETNQDKKTNS